jgi:DNA-binding PadR family transcriptional regulator
MKSKESNQSPLATAALHILLALSESDLHGYGIMQSIKRQSEGNYRVGPGTLYANLAGLLDKGWVGETQRAMEDGSMRREYFLTTNGKQVLRVEIQRLQQLVASARKRLTKLDARDA